VKVPVYFGAKIVVAIYDNKYGYRFNGVKFFNSVHFNIFINHNQLVNIASFGLNCAYIDWLLWEGEKMFMVVIILQHISVNLRIQLSVLTKCLIAGALLYPKMQRCESFNFKFDWQAQVGGGRKVDDIGRAGLEE
jgi:hypothetical protein